MSWIQRILGLADTPPLTQSSGMMTSPWSEPGKLSKVVLEDIAGLTDNMTYVTRSQAVLVPAVMRARGLVCGTLSRFPLKAYKVDQELATQPAWLYRTNTTTPVRQRMVWTLDDLIFNGHALWLTERSTSGQILDAYRAPSHRWRLNDTNGIDVLEGVKWRTMAPAEYIYFTSPQDALLSAGALAIRTALAVQKGTASRAASPVPIINIQLTENHSLDDDEIKELQANWAKARAAEYGAVAVTQAGVEVVEMGTGQGAGDLMESARNASRIDIANLVGIPASELDGSLATSTLTYTTTEGNRSRLNDGLEQWRTAVEDRLSQDDCTVRGTRVGFDLSALFGDRDGTDPALED